MSNLWGEPDEGPDENRGEALKRKVLAQPNPKGVVKVWATQAREFIDNHPGFNWRDRLTLGFLVTKTADFCGDVYIGNDKITQVVGKANDSTFRRCMIKAESLAPMLFQRIKVRKRHPKETGRRIISPALEAWAEAGFPAGAKLFECPAQAPEKRPSRRAESAVDCRADRTADCRADRTADCRADRTPNKRETLVSLEERETKENCACDSSLDTPARERTHAHARADRDAGPVALLDAQAPEEPEAPPMEPEGGEAVEVLEEPTERSQQSPDRKLSHFKRDEKRSGFQDQDLDAEIRELRERIARAEEEGRPESMIRGSREVLDKLEAARREKALFGGPAPPEEASPAGLRPPTVPGDAEVIRTLRLLKPGCNDHAKRRATATLCRLFRATDGPGKKGKGYSKCYSDTVDMVCRGETDAEALVYAYRRAAGFGVKHPGRAFKSNLDRYWEVYPPNNGLPLDAVMSRLGALPGARPDWRPGGESSGEPPG